MKKKFSTVLLSSTLLLTSVASLQPHYVQAESVGQMTTVTVDNEEGESVADITVSIYSGTQLVQSSKTNQQGQAIFDHLDPAKMYTIKVEDIVISNAYVQVGRDIRVAVDSASLKAMQTKGVTFNAYVVNNQLQNVEGQLVKLVNTSQGRRETVEQKTDKEGKATFRHLPERNSFAVYVNGINQGYTIRGSEASEIAYTFYVNKKGSGHYQVPTQPVTVTLLDEESEPIAAQQIELYRGKHKISALRTNKEGQISTTQHITVGTQYDIYVNGKKINNQFVKAGESVYVYLRADQWTAPKSGQSEGVTFKGYVINDKYQNVKGQRVKLIDTTQGRKVYGEQKTDKNGQVIFKHLPENRSFAVYINNVNQGYTIRGSEGAQIAYTFYVNKQGAGYYQFDNPPATVLTLNENGEPLAGQKVELYRDKQKVRSSRTNSKGQISFKKNITIGTQYKIYVNGKKINNQFVKAGETVSVYLLEKDRVKR